MGNIGGTLTPGKVLDHTVSISLGPQCEETETETNYITDN